MADGGLKRSRDYDRDDPFENFQFEPPRPSGSHGGFRTSFTRRSKYRALANMSSLSGSRDFGSAPFGSNTSLSAMSGTNLTLNLFCS